MNLNFFVLYTILTVFSASAALEYAPIVNTKHGQIRGLINTVGLWTKSYFYQGIRYGWIEIDLDLQINYFKFFLYCSNG